MAGGRNVLGGVTLETLRDYDSPPQQVNVRIPITPNGVGHAVATVGSVKWTSDDDLGGLLRTGPLDDVTWMPRRARPD